MRQAMTTLQSWIAAACAELGLEQAVVDERAVLDLARDVAHGVDRPAAPVTAFLLGVAVGRGQDLIQAAGRLVELAERWQDATGQEQAAHDEAAHENRHAVGPKPPDPSSDQSS
jgi:hypothetical protein